MRETEGVAAGIMHDFDVIADRIRNAATSPAFGPPSELTIAAISAAAAPCPSGSAPDR